MTEPIGTGIREFYFETVAGASYMVVHPDYQTPEAAAPDRAIQLPAGAKTLLLSWTGPEEVRIVMTNYRTASGSQLFTAGTIPEGVHGTPRMLSIPASTTADHYLYVNLGSVPAATTVSQSHRLSVVMLPLS